MRSILALYITLMPVILAGVLNMIFCKSSLLDAAYRPMDAGLILEEELALIEGSHPLSSDLDTYAFVGYMNSQPCIRGLLTFYPNDEAAYLGFFESINDQQIASAFIEHLAGFARSLGAIKIIGPVQASFWLGYRMQLSGTEDVPFTGEPHNPAYYPELWKAAGFELKERYLSNFYPKVSNQTHQVKLAHRFESFEEAGFTICSPKKKEWDQASLQVFELLNRLYQDFPIYRSISSQQFSQIFQKYQYILDFSMVKLAYKEGKLAGFLIAMPDYGSLVYQKLTLLNLAKLFWTKRFPKRYMIMYLGVDEEFLGLGSALAYPIFKEAQKRQASAIGALIHQKTVTRHYAAELQGDKHEYGLFELDL
ncbi:hypothetical protein [uncultured Streptococcus sp.]|uniref:hypothetical protein n=1 Tax=uncultured Streptococcus sp. TaxID=83427 RepID=UPI0028E7C7A2|nr:hypothetical protein [uncultured Streptococcus sp.]